MENKKDSEVKTETTETKTVEKKKGGAGKIVMIVLAVILVILLLCGGVAFFAYRSATDRVEEVSDVWREVEQEVEREIEEFEEEAFDYNQEDEAEESEYPKTDEQLLEQNLISDRFPEDIPLPGGQVRDSSFDRWSVNVNIMTSSSVEEAFLWYEETMEGTDWVITSKGRQDDSASINFENELEDDDFRRGEISITKSWRGYTNIMVRERY